MSSQQYYHTETEFAANREVTDVAFYVNCAGIVDETSEFCNSASRRDFYYLYLQSGKLTMPEGDVEPGDFIIFKPGYKFNYKSIGPTSYLWVHFTGYDAAKFLKNNNIDTDVICHIGLNRDIKDRFDDLYKEFMINDSKSVELMNMITKEILLLSSRYISKNEYFSLPLKAIQYITRNYSSDIEVGFLASLEGMGLTRFRKIFKDHTGMSPCEYIISRRISAACRLLIQTNLDIGEIAEKVGYDDQYYFGRIFKKKIGISPGRYRAK